MFIMIKQMFGRELKSSIAKDNGRSEEFIRKRTYPDKSRCYECGETGHLSYQCPENALGSRAPPEKVKKERKTRALGDAESAEDDNDDIEDPALDSLGAAISYQVFFIVINECMNHFT